MTRKRKWFAFLIGINKVPSYISVVELAWRITKCNNQNKLISLHVIPECMYRRKLGCGADNSTSQWIVMVFCLAEVIINAELSKY